MLRAAKLARVAGRGVVGESEEEPTESEAEEDDSLLRGAAAGGGEDVPVERAAVVQAHAWAVREVGTRSCDAA